MESLRQSLRTKLMRPNSVPIFKILVVLCVSLDLFAYFGMRLAPATVSAVVCTLRPLGAVAEPLMRSAYLEYIANACAGFRIEPAISIIIFTIKTSLAIVGFIIGLLFVLLIAPLLEEPTDPRPSFFLTKSHFKEAVKYALSVGFFIAITSVLWLLWMAYRPQEFGTSLIDKIVVEDCGLILGLLVNGVAVMLPISIALLWFADRKHP